MLKKATILAVVVTSLCSGFMGRTALAATIHVDPGTYAAIAHSPSTGDYSFAFNCHNRFEAQALAKARCHQEDARIVAWTRHGFVALAVGEDKTQWGVAYSQGAGANSKEAKNLALEEINKRTCNGHVVLCVVTDGQYVYRR